ncbi:MAG: porin [Burkholderiaceae bacterium]|jgi:predicted porin|nr:porin [Burkholderiaceae bacterium]
MKKSLIALAVLGLSSVAMAQSSVTLYGVADAGVGKIKRLSGPAPVSGGLSGVSGSSDANNKTQFLSGSMMNNGTSRLGVRGIEDLGGGMQAGFNFETGLDLDSGATVNSANGGTWGRQANVWLTGPWGTVKLGRQYTPSFLTTQMFDLTYAANYSLHGLVFDYVSISPRANSAFAYVTPTFAGFTGAIAYVTKPDLNDMLGLVSPDSVNKAAWDLGLMYANGPLSAGLSVNKVVDSKTNFVLGAKYSFGNFTLAASYTQASNPLSKAVRRGFGIGGTATFGAFSVTLDIMRDTRNQWNNVGIVPPGRNGKKYTNGLVEVKYNLSKRTFLYGTYLRMDGTYIDGGNNAPASKYGSTNNYGIGIRHNF